MTQNVISPSVRSVDMINMDQYKPRKQLTSAKLSKESISGVYLDIGPLKNSKKERFEGVMVSL